MEQEPIGPPFYLDEVAVPLPGGGTTPALGAPAFELVAGLNPSTFPIEGPTIFDETFEGWHGPEYGTGATIFDESFDSGWP